MLPAFFKSLITDFKFVSFQVETDDDSVMDDYRPISQFTVDYDYSYDIIESDAGKWALATEGNSLIFFSNRKMKSMPKKAQQKAIAFRKTLE